MFDDTVTTSNTHTTLIQFVKKITACKCILQLFIECRYSEGDRKYWIRRWVFISVPLCRTSIPMEDVHSNRI